MKRDEKDTQQKPDKTLSEKRTSSLQWRTMGYRVALVIVVLLAIGLRGWNLPSYMHFADDEARDARLIMEAIEDREPVLLGPSASVGDFSLGPAFYYLEAPFFFLLNGDPISGGILAALFSVAAVLLVLRAGHRMFGRVAAVSAGLLLATSFLSVLHGRWGWNPNLLPFFVLLFVYGLWRIRMREDKGLGGAGTGLEFAALGLVVAAQLHATAWGLIVPLIVFFVWLRPRLYPGEIVTSVLLVIGGFLPLGIHEYRTGGELTRGVLNWMQSLVSGSGGGSIVERVLMRGQEILEIVSQFLTSYSNAWVGGILLLVLFVVLGIASFRRLPGEKKEQREKHGEPEVLAERRKVQRMADEHKLRGMRFAARLLLMILVVQLVPLLLLSDVLFPHYVIVAMPVLFLTVGLGAKLLWDLRAHPALLGIAVAVPVLMLIVLNGHTTWRYWSGLEAGNWEGDYPVPMQDILLAGGIVKEHAPLLNVDDSEIGTKDQPILLFVDYEGEDFDDALEYVLGRNDVFVETIDDPLRSHFIIEKSSTSMNELLFVNESAGRLRVKYAAQM